MRDRAKKRADQERADAIRRQSSEVQNHLIDEYSYGKITRREFIRRGTLWHPRRRFPDFPGNPGRSLLTGDNSGYHYCRWRRDNRTRPRDNRCWPNHNRYAGRTCHGASGHPGSRRGDRTGADQ